MTLHTDWSAAKKDSMTKFKAAKKAKRDELEKKIKEGDKKAKAQQLDSALAEMGVVGASDDVETFFRFKEDLGPNLDKLDKLATAKAAASNRDRAITGIEQVLADKALSTALSKCAKAMGVDDFYAFCTAGWKADPVKSVPIFIARGAPMEINIDDQYLQPLRALAGQPAQLKAQEDAARQQAELRKQIEARQLDFQKQQRENQQQQRRKMAEQQDAIALKQIEIEKEMAAQQVKLAEGQLAMATNLGGTVFSTMGIGGFHSPKGRFHSPKGRRHSPHAARH